MGRPITTARTSRSTPSGSATTFASSISRARQATVPPWLSTRAPSKPSTSAVRSSTASNSTSTTCRFCRARDGAAWLQSRESTRCAANDLPAGASPCDAAGVIIEGLLVAFVVLIGSLFLIGGTALFKGVGEHLWERWGSFFAAIESQRWVTTTGKVTRAVVTYTTSRRARSYAPAVRYKYSVGGESFVSERFAFVVTESVGEDGAAVARAVVERFPTGGSVPVYYDPKNPKRATLDRGIPPVVGPTLGWLLVLLVGGGVMFPLGVIIVKGPFEDPPNLGD